MVAIETLTPSDLDQLFLTDVVWLRHGSVLITKKCRLNLLDIVGTGSKSFSMGDITLARSSSRVQSIQVYGSNWSEVNSKVTSRWLVAEYLSPPIVI